MALLLPDQNRKSVVRFSLMLMLSVTIAVMGLAANSAAVVIGAMLIAPLMTPIMSFAAAVGLGLGKRAVQAAFLVVAGSAGSIAFAVLLARLLPTVEIGAEVLARTRPDVRDLIVAVAAGAAGAYATAREDMSGALPGVAVAVALVPPLAATGILLDADRMVLAQGSGLLFLTNLLAIIVSALVVLLATGVIPTIRLCFQSSRIALHDGRDRDCHGGDRDPADDAFVRRRNVVTPGERDRRHDRGVVGSDPTRRQRLQHRRLPGWSSS